VAWPAYAVRRLPLLDQLELTVELLNDVYGPEAELPSNVIPFRPRRTRQEPQQLSGP
jgi:hypothetical protein